MHRIDHATALADANGAGKDGFTEGSPGVSSPTRVTDDWLNSIQEEIANVVEEAGIELDKEDFTQLYQALVALIPALGISDGTITAAKLSATIDLSAKTLTLSAAQKANDYIEIRDEKATNTDGGTFTSGAWRTRDLNTESSDAGNHASVAANQTTLAAGTYVCDIDAPAAVVDHHQAKLYNVTDAADVIIGTSEYTGTTGTKSSRSRITGRFTIAGTKVFEVRHQCETTRATDGLGNACNFGVVEVYTIARFWKVG